MIKELPWDSALFRRKMGVLTNVSRAPGGLKNALKKAKKDGFSYITCKLFTQDAACIKNLESHGFYLTDIGVTLAMDIQGSARGKRKGFLTTRKSIQAATLQDIPIVRKYVTSLFTDSRFYHDPFFSKKDADRLYQAWIENSVKGEAADIVYHMQGKGFISCRKYGKNTGQIVLIGVQKRYRGKGYGAALMAEAMEWFARERCKIVSVRTQLRNIHALNFYLHTGFMVKEYDLVFGKIL
jgi:dTDP-4-amino-4,6-dideoxy-D-galactose acyltransferase